MKLLLLLLLISSPLSAKWDEWSIEDQNLFKLLIFGSALDYMQTKNGLKNGYTEGNPLYGSTPSSDRMLIQKSISLGVIYYVVDEHWSRSYRRSGLILANGIQWGIVIHNESVGATFRYAW